MGVFFFASSGVRPLSPPPEKTNDGSTLDDKKTKTYTPSFLRADMPRATLAARRPEQLALDATAPARKEGERFGGVLLVGLGARSRVCILMMRRG